jgi:hypothetical protein
MSICNEKLKLAALKTYILWSWLEKNNHQAKCRYPLFHELKYSRMNNICPWCDIIYSKIYECTFCPLNDVYNRCMDDGSFYDKWFYESSAVAAGDIAAVAWQTYKQLGG